MDMTHEQYLALLTDYDDPVLAEYPNGFDREEAKREFTRFAASVLVEFEEAAIKMGMRIQDTSFHGQIILAHFLLQGCDVNVSGDPLYIRVRTSAGLLRHIEPIVAEKFSKDIPRFMQNCFVSLRQLSNGDTSMFP